MSRYFVTSVGTGIGKTFTTCALLHAAAAQGRPVWAYKPIISGWDEGDDTDTARIIAANAGRQSVAETSPWRFKAPLSPHRAAALEGGSIDFHALCDWSKTQMQQPGLVLIEGVGGVMVPLDGQHTVLDWMQALAVPVILVTGSYLGAISHTLTALAVLKQARIPVAALVVNESVSSEISFAEAEAGLLPFVTNIPLRIFQRRVSSPEAAVETAGLLSHL